MYCAVAVMGLDSCQHASAQHAPHACKILQLMSMCHTNQVPYKPANSHKYIQSHLRTGPAVQDLDGHDMRGVHARRHPPPHDEELCCHRHASPAGHGRQPSQRHGATTLNVMTLNFARMCICAGSMELHACRILVRPILKTLHVRICTDKHVPAAAA